MKRGTTQRLRPLDEATLVARHAIIALMKAADGARREMTRSLQPFDLTLAQFNVLTILLVHGELPTFQVVARLVENTPGITRLMGKLERKRFIRRYQSGTDRRQQLCALTPAGKRVVERAIPPFSAAQRLLVDDFERGDVLQLTDLLGRVPPPSRAKR